MGVLEFVKPPEREPFMGCGRCYRCISIDLAPDCGGPEEPEQLGPAIVIMFPALRVRGTAGVLPFRDGRRA